VFAALVCSVAVGCNRPQPAGHEVDAGRPPQPVAAATAPATYDRELTDTARLLGGMRAEDEQRFAKVMGLQTWQDYRASMDDNWTRERDGRFAAIAGWRDRELGGAGARCGVLLYPFGGPDILHATLFFPRCQTFVLFGLEHLGSVPRFDRLSAERLDRLVGDLRASMVDFFTRQYFITKEMESELADRDLDGITPLLLMLLARQDARIVGVDRVVLTGEGATPEPATQGPSAGGPPLVGSRVRFLGAGRDEPQEVIYFRAPADNARLERQPAIEAYLRHLAPATTFIKSASYLLHTNEFSRMRSVILDTSSVLLQDDSGVPYRFLTSPPWRVTLYGQYARPIADFNYGFQKNLEAAYAEAAPGSLPFTFGYHWRDQISGVMLASRDAAASR